MKKLATKVAATATVFLAGGLFLSVNAQGNLLPAQITDIFNLLGPEGSGSAGFVTSRIQLGLVLALGLVVLVSVVYAILAAFKYIQSQGDAGKIEEAQKAIKAIFFGIAAMLLAVVGIVLVFVFFGASQPRADLTQTCLSAPGSPACQICKDQGIVGICQSCEDEFKEVVAGTKTLDSLSPDCKDPVTN